MDYDKLYDLLSEAASICDDGRYNAQQEKRGAIGEVFREAQKVLERGMDYIDQGY